MITHANLRDSLIQIGLNTKEAEVYIALFSLESSTAYRIAEKCNVKKPTVYVILEELRQKGLVLKIPHPKKTLFAARNLREYLEERERGVERARTLLPMFEHLRVVPGTAVYFYSGLSGMREALNYKFDTMKDGSYLSFYCNLEGVHSEIQALYDAWDQTAIASGTRFQIIRTKTKTQRVKWKSEGVRHLNKDELESVEMRYVETSVYPSNISFEIAKNFVRITDAHNYFATIIDNTHTADALRQIFTIVWNGAEQ